MLTPKYPGPFFTANWTDSTIKPFALITPSNVEWFTTNATTS
ncbi:28158_t:CDS:1, partial [Racocetra persica]